MGVLLVWPSLAKKHHNPLWQWMYMRDPVNYTHSVQTASNKPNNQVDNRRQRYFDSTSYNYQQYYTHEGKLNMTNQANSTAINNWLQSYDDLTRTLSSKEAQYKLLGKFPHACKFRYPLGTYQGNSHSHALVARPNKRRVTIPNGGYQAYHAQRHDNLQVVYKYASEWGLKAQRKALFKGFFPHWYNIEKPDTHYPMPLRRFRTGEIKPNYMRDQWRLPPCMSPKPFKAPKKGFIHKAMGDPRWYQAFQKYPHVWDEMCESPTGQKMKMCLGLKRSFNASVTTDGAFKLWQNKRILARPHMANLPLRLKPQFQCRFLSTPEQIKECSFKLMAGKPTTTEPVSTTALASTTTTTSTTSTSTTSTTQVARSTTTSDEGGRRRRSADSSSSEVVTCFTISLVSLLLSTLLA